MAKPYNWLDFYKRSQNFSNAIADSFKTGRFITSFQDDGGVNVGKGAGAVYHDGYRTPQPYYQKYVDGKPEGYYHANAYLPEGTEHHYLQLLMNSDESPANRASQMQAYGYEMPLDVARLAEYETPEYKEQKARQQEEADLVSRARLRMAADAKPLNPLGKTALDVAFYEGPLDWYKRKGFKDTDIKEIQNFLIQNGYNVGKLGADGKMGQDTLRAIKQFQRNNGLAVDGKFGNLSRSKMQEIIAKRATEEARRNTQVKQNAYNELTTAPYVAPNATVQDPRYFSENRGPVFKIGGKINYQKIFK